MLNIDKFHFVLLRILFMRKIGNINGLLTIPKRSLIDYN